MYLELGKSALRPTHDKPLALGDHQPLIGVDIAKFLDPAAGPAHHQPLDLGGLLQSKVSADVAVRQEAGPRGNLADLDAAGDPRLNAGPNAVPIARSANEGDLKQ